MAADKEALCRDGILDLLAAEGEGTLSLPSGINAPRDARALLKTNTGSAQNNCAVKGTK